MNEQIKALAQQAGESIPEFHFGDWNIPNEFIQKFAELIVRECADWLKQPVNQTPSCGTVMNITAERLKEHFGVEE